MKAFLKSCVLNIVIITVVVLGVIVLGLGIAIYSNEQNQIKDYELVVGTLIAHVEMDDQYFCPTYEYSVDGKTYYVQSDYGTKVREEVGTRQEIYYDPANPSLAIIKEFNPDVLLIVIGLMMICAPLVAYVVDYGDNRRDSHLDAKSVFVIALGIAFYCLAGNLIGNYLPGTLMVYSPLLVIVPAAFVIVGIYTLVKIVIADRKKKIHARKKKETISVSTSDVVVASEEKPKRKSTRKKKVTKAKED